MIITTASPTWAGATRREVLPVLSWAPDRIETRMVEGVLASERSLYVYVVAPDGSVNADGIKLTCSGTRRCV